jgi:hypothetical protein
MAARLQRESLESLLAKIIAHDDDWINIRAFIAEVARDNDSFVPYVYLFLLTFHSNSLARETIEQAGKTYARVLD